jgi:hypothetical protein
MHFIEEATIPASAGNFAQTADLLRMAATPTTLTVLLPAAAKGMYLNAELATRRAI